MQRTGRSVNGEEEDYLLDFTRGYHNLLGIQKNESGQRFYFDWNVAAMEETGGRTRPAYGAAEERRTAFSGLHYYLQDELGSPLCVSGYGKGEGADIPGYLTYGYDEFGNGLGNDLGKELDEAGIPNPYDRQGEEQPFGYTGYRYDGISGTYFAQAREYQPGNGRFTAEDVIKGNGALLQSLNRYVYCTNNAINYFDPLGFEKIVVSGGIYKQEKYDKNEYYYEFIDAGLAQINEWNNYNTDEEITWIIADNGWSNLNKSEFVKAADYNNVNLIFIEDKDELINYLNYKSDDDNNAILRENDKISDISFFSHGLASNNGIISLGFNYDDYDINLNIQIDDLEKIESDIFADDITSYIYSCNSGTAGAESIGQKWANLTGGKTYAFYGKSDYAGCSDKSLLAKIIRNIYEILYNVSAFGGKTSLPKAGVNSYQVEFCPE